MKIFNSLRVAIAMFSKIPVGRADWNKENMKYSMCFVPVVGVMLGAVQIGWWYLAMALSLNRVLCSTIAVILPLLVTGGIHMDGFCDVVDALSSYGSKEKKLEILKDPHIGAFAMMWCGAYMLGCVGAFCQLQTLETLWAIGIGYILSRSVSCLLALILKNAKREGSLYSFTSTQEKAVVSGILMFWIFASMIAIFIIDVILGTVIAVVVALMVLYYCWMIDHHFGGITGDMAGYLIQMLELLILYAAVVGEILWRFI